MIIYKRWTRGYGNTGIQRRLPSIEAMDVWTAVLALAGLLGLWVIGG